MGSFVKLRLPSVVLADLMRTRERVCAHDFEKAASKRKGLVLPLLMAHAFTVYRMHARLRALVCSQAKVEGGRPDLAVERLKETGRTKTSQKQGGEI